MAGLDVYAGGWRWRTRLPLPAALPWPGTGGRPDVTFVSGVVPEALDSPALDLPVLQMTDDGTALVRFDGIGRFLVRGKRVTCDLETKPDDPVISTILFGNVLACLCWQRGQLPLHGSAVAIDGRAVLLLGRAATGKSMLAATLALRGHCVLSDELAVVSEGACLPSGGALSLADDALDRLGISGADLPLYENFSLSKRLWRAGSTADARPYPIGAVICLGKAEIDATTTLERLEGEAAVAAILNQVYWRGMLKVGDSEATARRAAAQLVEAVPVHQLPIARRLEEIEPAATLIESLRARPGQQL